jgi:phosphate transport system substrate-binding protein
MRRNLKSGLHLGLVLAGLALAGLGCSGCGGGNPSGTGGADGGATTPPPTEIVEVEGLEGLSGSVAIDGSSTVFPVTEAVAEEFQIATSSSVKVTVGISGTGGGFKKFYRGETDISDASRPILTEEIEECKKAGIEYIELPVCFDALTVAVNKDNDWVDTITVEELKKIWEPDAQGKITHWNQVRPEWPNEPIALFGAGTDSGTFDYFTEAIVGKAKSSRGDFTHSEDDNTLVQGIEGNKYALGYIPYAYFEPNQSRLKALKIDKGDGNGVGPSAEAVIAGTYQPLSRPLFLYVSKKSAERPEVKKFIEFYLANVPALSQEVKYTPLPEDAYPKVSERFAKLETGSAFGGVPEVGISINDILSRPLVK